jgi:signal transduction histidine kinase
LLATTWQTITHPDDLNTNITDNGSGINIENIARIFDPFFTIKPPGKGSGLGLSISYQIVVEKHGGHLKCKSLAGEGIEMAIWLPIVQKNAI